MMKFSARLLCLGAVVVFFAGLASQAAQAQCVSLTTAGSAVTQNFDTLSNTAGSTTNNLTITGWFMTESGGGARDNEQYAVDTGGSNTGDTYSYGSAGATDRALGGLQSGTLIPLFGACFTNNTGVTLTSLLVAYTGEQWRLGTAARTDQINFEYSTNATDLVTGTWTAVSALNFVTPVTATTGAKDGNNAANRTALSNTIASLSITNGSTFWIRWVDFNASGADDGLAVDDFSLTPNPGGGPVTPNLTINDVALAEGNAGTTNFIFTVSLSAPANAGGVTFDIATADGTAQDDNPTTEDNDYVAQSLTGQTIPAGSSTYAFTVQVNGDTAAEANETFFVNVTNVTGANVSDGQGQGTINNDDVAITLVHDLQGPGASSPIVGASVTVRAVVTGVRGNGFFVQEEEADYDADPLTSEGVLVFTSSAPPAAAAVGNLVQVTGTVTEFVPTQDPLQPPLTEITSPTAVLISSGNPLPAPVPLTATFPDPAGVHDQLERVEGMRVSVSSLTVSGPTLGNVNEPNATATSTGVFYGVVTGNARPFREAGIQAPDPPPAGTIPPIPRFDSNPERIRVDSDNLVGSLAIEVGAGAVVSNLVGPLDYTFRTYSISPDPASPPSVAGGPPGSAVTVPTRKEFTVAAYNLERFFDTVNDPAIGEPVLTATAFNNRLFKASLGIRDSLQTPDIVGIVECENLSTLQALAARISSDAIAAGDPDPEYDAFLVEGNDVGGIDVGFLVKTAPVAGATPRVNVLSVVQEGLTTTITNPDASTELLNDRPPLVLDAVINHPNGASFPVVVIVNHLRSLNGVADPGPGPNGWATGGDRVRNKRQKQAEFLANLVQARQVADPTEHIILLGDFNAFEFNDGLGDSMNVIAGTPPPDNQTVVPGDGVDLVTPDFDNLFDSPPPAERYSFIFDGNAQSLDHVLINQPLINDTLARREEHPRINTDFPETARNDATTVFRLSDHDPVVSFYTVGAFCETDLAVVKVDMPDPVLPGGVLSYGITVTNNGPDAAANVELTDTIPAGTAFLALTVPGGWSCTTPAVGAGGTVSCTIASLANGASEVFTLQVTVDAATSVGTVISNTAAVTTNTADSDPANDSATATTTVAGAQADLSVLKDDTADPVLAGANLTYTITVNNEGPSIASNVALSDPLPAGTTFVSLTAPGGWSCTTPAVGAAGTVNCSTASLGLTSASFTLVVQVGSGVASGTILSNTVAVSSATTESNPGNETDTELTVVGSTSAGVSLTKTESVDPVIAGQDLTYTLTAGITVTDATNLALVDPLPPGTTFQSITAPAPFSCSTPAVGATGTVTCTAASAAAGTYAFTLVVNVTAGTSAGTTLSNTGALNLDTDGRPVVATDSETTGVISPAALSAEKSVTGSFVPGGAITYSIVMSNAGPATQQDNPGDEFVDVLPPELVLTSVTASSGTVASAANVVTWNGSIPNAGTVVITIQATIAFSAPPETIITNQAEVFFDGDGDGTNEQQATSDDPAVGGADDPTEFVLGEPPVLEIPTLGQWGLMLLAAALALAALVLMRRRV